MLQETGNAPLLMAHGMTNDLRWVGCEDQTDIEFLEQGLKLGRGNVETSQSLKQFSECCWFGLGRQRRSEWIDVLCLVL